MEIIGVTVLCLLLLQILLFRTFVPLKKEIKNLKGETMTWDMKHPAMGMNINELIKTNQVLSEKQGIYMFTLPHCSSCYSQIEQAITIMKTYNNVPKSSVVIPEEEEFLKSEFLAKYSGFINIIFTSYEILDGNMDYPTMLTVDKKGKVKEVYGNIEYAYMFYEEEMVTTYG